MGVHLIPLVIVSLGFGSSICGHIAQYRRPKRDDIRLEMGECVYPDNPAYPLGLAAAALLLLAVALATYCGTCCCRRRDGVSTWRFGLGILLAVLSWLAASIVVSDFRLGAAANQPGRRGKAPECYAYDHADNVFRRAADGALFTTCMAVFSHKMLHTDMGDKLPVAS